MTDNLDLNGPVLIVDDSLTIRKLLEMTLTRAGIPCECAALGREGLALAKRLRPRLILLDYVLPDVRGSEICTELARDPLTADVPVVVMSGKGDDIRPLFKAERTVVDFVAKPFSPAEILHVIERAVRSRTPAATAPTTAPATTALQPEAQSAPRDPREAAAKVLFNAMRERLAKVPEWLLEAAGQPPAAFLARRLFTSEVVGNVLTGMTTLVAPAVTSPTPAEAVFAGSTTFLHVPNLLRLIAESHRTGVLRLGSAQGEDGALVWFARGDLQLAAPRDAAAGTRLLVNAGIVSEPGRTSAVSATADLVPAVIAAHHADAGEALAVLGRQTLVRLMGEGPLAWDWKDLPQLPEAIIALAGTGISLDQLLLDRLRLVDDWSQIELDVHSLGQTCARAPDVRERLQRFTLTADEARVLQHVDGRRSVQDLVTRTSLSTFETFHILYRLIQVRLVTSAPPSQALAAPVLLCGSDESTSVPLSNWLEKRADRLRCLSVEPAQLVACITQQAPRLVLIDLAGTPGEAALAAAIRGQIETADARLVALVPQADRARVAELRTVGFDDVLVRPIHLNAIGRLLQDAQSPGSSP
jgi:DNA-binding response OmpR family regulator